MSAEKIANIPSSPIDTGDETPVLKERIVQNPEELSAREISKIEMTDERTKLAAELRQERKEGKDKISELRVRANLLKIKLEQAGQSSESAQKAIEQLETIRTERANSLTGRFRSFLGIETKRDKEIQESLAAQNATLELSQTERDEAIPELEDSMNNLVDADAALHSIRGKVAAHYGEAMERGQSRVEQTILRNNAFFVHTILEDSHQHHNANSNVSAEAGFEDDLDILLSLEPSVSASSVMPGADAEGRISGVWGDSPSGVLIGGGKINLYSENDSETVSRGIKERVQPEIPEHAREYIPEAKTFNNRDENWVKELDNVTQRRGTYLEGGIVQDKAYNEFVIDNPEVMGYFKAGEQDEQGKFWINNLEIKQKLGELHKQYAYDPNSSVYALLLDQFNEEVGSYRGRFDAIKAKGLPFYVMAPDRRFHEVLNINDNGSLDIGAELTPEQAARSNAGLPPEKRKELGKKVLERNVFRSEETHREAQGIVDNL